MATMTIGLQHPRAAMALLDARSHHDALHRVHKEVVEHWDVYENSGVAEFIAFLDGVTWALTSDYLLALLDSIEAVADDSGSVAVLQTIREARREIRVLMQSAPPGT